MGKGSLGQAWRRMCSRLPVYFGGEHTPSEQTLDEARIPAHIAVIMDGNRRWARKASLPVAAGHSAGVEALRGVIRECDRLGVRVLTIYAFSTENWRRSTEEVGALMALLLRYFSSEIDELCEKKVRIRILGDVDSLPEAQRRAVLSAMERTGDNEGLQLNIALNYGGRDELLKAAQSLARQAAAGEVDPERITPEQLESALYTHGQPDVDLLIRTSGEMRLSNFLPWQSAYAELVFVDTLWPDFTPEDLRRCIAVYQSRDRRFGGTTTGEVKK